MRVAAAVLVSVACAAAAARAQSPDLAVVNRIKAEAFDRSQVMETLRNLTDVHGARLTASPQFDAAAEWTVQRLKGYGLSNVHLEPWGPFGRSWAAARYSVEQIQPVYMQLDAAPLAWTGSTAGPVEGTPMLTPLDVSFVRGPKRIAAAFDTFKQEWAGKLRGRIILLSAVRPESPREEALFSRLTEANLQRIGAAPDPAAKLTATNVDWFPGPDPPADPDQFFCYIPAAVEDRFFARVDELIGQRAAWFAAEGVSAILMSDERAREGLLAGEAAG